MRKRFLEIERPRLKHYGFKRLVWRIFGVIGHAVFRRFPPDIATNDGKRFLNLGAGGVRLDGFVNADFYRLHHMLKFNSADWMIDITKPWKCKHDYWDGVMIEHTNEHILYSENYDMLTELYRTMKPGGVLRIVVPDLGRYLRWEILKRTEAKMNRYGSLPEAISNLTQNHLHISVWDFSLMAELLDDIGYSEIVESKFGDSRVKEFVDSPNHEWQSLYLEAVKPLS
jgi:predicted SAM-dependent methyltransferase